MRATEIIRGILDLIDQVDATAETEVEIASVPDDTDELARMRQIAGLTMEPLDPGEYSNTPHEAIAPIDAVVASGTDMHHSKATSDIRGNSFSLFPNFQAKE
jgi:hypothetical protein